MQRKGRQLSLCVASSVNATFISSFNQVNQPISHLCRFLSVSILHHHHHHMLDRVLSPSTELAGFRMAIVFTTPRHFVRSHSSSFPSPFFFISFSTCFFHVCFGLPLPLLPLTSNFKAFTITFSSSFLKAWPYHRILLALAILSIDSFVPNMSINSSLFLRSNSFTPHITRIIALSVLLKIAMSFSFRHHASLPYNITDLTQLL